MTNESKADIMLTTTSPEERESRERDLTSRRTVVKSALAGAAGIAGGMAANSTYAQDAAATPVASETASSEKQPNILMIMVDEMRDWQWFPEQEVLDEAFPNLARLQNGAVRFGRHYTASNMCTPARGTLLTGLYSHQTGIVLTQGGNVENLMGDGPLSHGSEATPETTPMPEPPPYPALDPRFPTWGTMLREEGYETYWWGKWHLSDDDATCNMEQYGFSGGTCPSPNGGPGGGMNQDPMIADQAIQWLENQNSDSPWCTTVSFVNPHDIQWYPRQTRKIEEQNDPESVFSELPPNYETAADIAEAGKPHLQLSAILGLAQVFGEVPHRGPNFERHWIKMLDLYYQFHQDVDKEIGRVLDALEARPEVAENTIIMFTSDHGEYCGSHGLRGKGAGLYEEGIRVPLWIKDPSGRFASQVDQVRNQITSSVDIAPMMLTLARGSNDWREEPERSYLADRLDLTAVMQDSEAAGRQYALHATDEDGYNYGPILFPFMREAPFHVMGLITEDAKLGVYTHWENDSFEFVRQGQEYELYDYSTEEGRLELVNTAGSENPQFREMYELLMSEAVPAELRATLPEELEVARQETMVATLARYEFDRQATE